MKSLPTFTSLKDLYEEVIVPDRFITLLKNTSKQLLPPLLSTINGLLDTFEHHSIVLRSSTRSKKVDSLSLILSIAIELAEEQQIELYNQIYLLVEKLINPIPPETKHYEYIYQIASLFASKALTAIELQKHFNVFKVCLTLLKLFAKRNSKKVNERFYFALGDSKTSANSHMQWPFTKVVFEFIV